VSAGQEITAADLENMTFVPDANWNGTATFEWVAADDHAYAATPATMTIIVAPVNDAPVATVPSGINVTEGTPATMNGISFADIDAANNPVTVTISVPEGSLAATSDAGVTVSGTAGALILTGSLTAINDFITAGNVSYTTILNPSATVTATVHVSDNGNTGSGGALQDTETFPLNITKTNTPPTGTGDTKTTLRDTPVNGSVVGADADGDALTYTKETDPAHGTVVVNADGTYTYTPTTGYTGGDSFTIKIDDGQGGSTTVTVNITVTPPPNNPPTGTGDTKTTTWNVPVNGNVTGSDPDGDALTYTKASDPAHGTVVVNADGTYTYTPTTGYTGGDSFTVKIDDGKGGTTTVIVNITVTAPPNNPPTGTGDTKTTTQDIPVSGNVTGSDPDGDALTYTKASDPANGTVVVNANGTYTYTPTTGYTGGDSFTVKIDDGKGGSTTVIVNITVNPVIPPPNNPPTGTGDTKTINQDTPVNGSVTGSDPDGDALTYTKASDPAHGTVVVNADGTYTYTPAAGYTGGDSFTVKIDDGKGGSTTVIVNITVNPVIPPPNNPPTGTGDTKTINQDTPVNGSVTGNDPDGDALTYIKASDPAHGTVVVNADGTYTYTPAAGYTGGDSFTVKIDDGKGGSTTVTVNITVNPVTPPANNPPTGFGDSKTTKENTPVSGNVTGSDPDGDALTFTKATDPAHGTVVVNADGTYTYTPTAGYTGLDNFNITISDGKGGTAIVTVNINVTAVIQDPVALNDGGETKANTPVTIDLLANDDGRNATLDLASIEIVAAPAHGTVKVNEDGTVVYTPDPGYTGDDTFTYQVKNANGQLSNVATVAVTVTATGINVPNLFTPNGDGKNDFFEIRGLNQYAENELVIVNRWGNEVYRQKGYQNTWKGDGLNEGTYYYLLRIRRNSSAEWEVMKGYVTLIRAFK
jgi:gliding motility-associated-like protein